MPASRSVTPRACTTSGSARWPLRGPSSTVIQSWRRRPGSPCRSRRGGRPTRGILCRTPGPTGRRRGATVVDTTSPDVEAQRDAFADRLFGSMNATFDLAAVYLGDRLGLYRALDASG